MRVASRVVLLLRDAAGYGAAIAAALRTPASGSHLTREASSFELPLDKYGLGGEKASGELIQFSDPHGLPQVSILVLSDYKPPVAACAVNEILALICSAEPSAEPALIVPYIAKSLSSYHEGLSMGTPGQLPPIYGTKIGAMTDFTRVLIDGTSKPPPSVKIHNEVIACLLQMVPVLKLPMALLITSSSQQQSKSSPDYDLQVLHHIGNHLARHINLEFSKQAVLEKGMDIPQVVREPWRELYG